MLYMALDDRLLACISLCVLLFIAVCHFVWSYTAVHVYYVWLSIAYVCVRVYVCGSPCSYHTTFALKGEGAGGFNEQLSNLKVRGFN